MSRRVVITGMGCVSPVGNSVDESWDNLIHGRSGIDIIPEWQEARYNDRPLTVHIGGQVRNFDPKDWITPAKDVRRMDRFIHLAVAAGEQAWKDSGLPERLSEEDAVKMGGIIGVGLGGIITLLNEYERFVHGKARKVSAFMIPGIIGNLAPGHLAIRHNFKGPNWAPASACSSGAHGIGESYQHILDGRADMMVCGGSEAALHPLAMMGFASMNALCSTHNEDPKNASRPFEVAGKQPFIAPRKHQDHGSVLTDMDVFHKDGTKTHLSAKLGPSLTFINPGSKTLFSDQDVKDHDISKDKGIALLKMCGLDEDAFCNVFNNFGKPAQKKKNLKHSGVKKVNTSILQNFVKTAMGSNYWMIHAKGNTQDEVNMYYMDPSDVDNKYSKITGNVEVFYGGRDGSGKRIDIAFANNHFSFNLNIRSKAGGTTYPTNIMLDYKTLSVKNKVTL